MYFKDFGRADANIVSYR